MGDRGKERPVLAVSRPDCSDLAILPIPLPRVVVTERLIDRELERLEHTLAAQRVLGLLKHEPGERLSRDLVLRKTRVKTVT